MTFLTGFTCHSRLLQDKTNSLINSYSEINRVVEELSTCPFTSQAFSELIAKIQAAVRAHSQIHLAIIPH